MAKNIDSSRDMGPPINSPPCSTGNAGGTKDAWESGSPMDKASDAALDYESSRDEE